MKISDYIVEYLISEDITDIFGYPGGMVTHLMDSLGKYSDRIDTHITYHEQAAAFAACGYAQASGKVGVAFATSGPGATNLITGIGHAYFDSVPTVFITGQVNTFESGRGYLARQRGFQETNIVDMVKPITKDAIYVENAEDIPRVFKHAFTCAQEGRKGPVLIDIPMNIFRTETDIESIVLEEESTGDESATAVEEFKDILEKEFKKSKRPCLLLGNGIKISGQIKNIRGILRSCPIPVVSSMLAVDIIPEGQGLEGIYYGFIGAYGNRTANFTVAKCDLLICLGSRLDVRQVGGIRENFAPDAKIIRVDIDKEELRNTVRDEELQFVIPLKEAIPALRYVLSKCDPYVEWLKICKEIKNQVKFFDEKEPNKYVNDISHIAPDECSITADVGQNMVWVAQSFKMKPSQRAYFSGGMGAMGYALPAACGVYYATKKPVLCFVGDGGLQMNIQELQFLVREHIPVKVFVINNVSLGMIRHFQEMYFDSEYCFTVKEKGYTVPNFVKIAEAYGISSHIITSRDEISTISFAKNDPELYEIKLSDDTVVIPKLEFGKPNQDQEPLLDRSLYKYLMEL